MDDRPAQGEIANRTGVAERFTIFRATDWAQGMLIDEVGITSLREVTGTDLAMGQLYFVTVSAKTR